VLRIELQNLINKGWIETAARCRPLEPLGVAANEREIQNGTTSITPIQQSNLQTTGFRSEDLLAPEQALTLFLARASLGAPATETVPIQSAFGRVLAQIVRPDSDYPAAARSAMDGFAIRASDFTARAESAPLRVVGAVLMGVPPQPLSAGCAMHIPTGGVLPPGADAVVPIEAARLVPGVPGLSKDDTSETITIDSPVKSGDCITPAGSDMRAGETLLEPGRRIGAPELAVLATLGIADVSVYRKPFIGVISSGAELVAVRSRPNVAQVRDSNRWAIAGALESRGILPVPYPIARDDPDRLSAVLQTALNECDGVILSGGSSVGEHDYTPRIIDSLGSPGVIVHGLRVRPGKPTVLASIAGKPVIGLPGNPTSALLILEAVVSPILAELTGSASRQSEIRAEAAHHYKKRAGWTWFVPVRLEEPPGRCVAHLLEIRSSAASLLARANGYAVLGEAIESVHVGEIVSVRNFQ